VCVWCVCVCVCVCVQNSYGISAKLRTVFFQLMEKSYSNVYRRLSIL